MCISVARAPIFFMPLLGWCSSNTRNLLRFRRLLLPGLRAFIFGVIPRIYIGSHAAFRINPANLSLAMSALVAASLGA